MIEKRKLFVFGASYALITKDLNQHYYIGSHRAMTFLECTQLCSFRNAPVFQVRKGNYWRFGKVQSIFAMDSAPIPKSLIGPDNRKSMGHLNFLLLWDSKMDKNCISLSSQEIGDRGNGMNICQSSSCNSYQQQTPV